MVNLDVRPNLLGTPSFHVDRELLRLWQVPYKYLNAAQVLGNTLVDYNVEKATLEVLLGGKVKCYRPYDFCSDAFWSDEICKEFLKRELTLFAKIKPSLIEKGQAIEKNYSNDVLQFYTSLSSEFGCALTTAYDLVARLEVDTVQKLDDLSLKRLVDEFNDRQIRELLNVVRRAGRDNQSSQPEWLHGQDMYNPRARAHYGAQSNPYLTRVR